jgi:YgiT-type zinc finger domain-containing protein
MSTLSKKKMHCGCGNELIEVRITVTWQGSDGKTYTIREVPSLQCHQRGCGEVYYSGDVEFNLSVLADEMEQSIPPQDIVLSRSLIEELLKRAV